MKLIKATLLVFIALLLTIQSKAQDAPIFTSDFTPEEFAQRREKVYDAIGPKSIAIIQGETAPRGYVKFRQTNEFYYLTGVEVAGAYLLLDGSSRRATLYLPHRNAGRERGEGKVLSAEDGEFLMGTIGFDAVYGPEHISENLGRMTRRNTSLITYTPFSPPEGAVESRDLAMRFQTDILSDPWDGRTSRHGHFMNLLTERFPEIQLKNLSPILDQLRLIKSEAELILIRKATRLSSLGLMESMRSTVPGMKEYELDAVSKYIFTRNGGQGDAYYSLIASSINAYFPHYHQGARTMEDGDFLLMDYAPDYAYYMSDITRMWPVNGKFSKDQRDLYGFYLACYKSILYNIKPYKTAKEVGAIAIKEMEEHLEKATFSKDIYKKAAENFVANYKRGNESRSTLGHFVGMATHDVGRLEGQYLPGMVFTIEPALRVPEEMIYIRLEDLIIIGENGAEIVSEFAPMDIDGIEKLMKEKGMSQVYPREKLPKN